MDLVSALKKKYANPSQFIKTWEYQEREVEEMKEKRYKTIEELPSWSKESISNMVKNGIIANRNNLDLSEDMVRMLVIMDRMVG